MSDDQEHVLEKDRKRFIALKAVYNQTRGDKSNPTTFREISQATGLYGDNGEELIQILQYLANEQLLKLHSNIYGGASAPVRITHQGVREVEAAIRKPENATEHFPAQVVNNIFAPVGSVQIGNSNTAKVTQHIGADTGKTAELADLVFQLRELVNQSSLSEDDKEEVTEAIEKLPELATKEQSPRVLERVKQRLTLTNDTLKPAKELYETAKPILVALYEFWKLHFLG